MRSLYAALLLIFLIASCSPARFVKPLEKRQHAAAVSLGGPLISYGKATIPIPFLTATYGYGIDSSLTGFASLNITSALYGNFQAELGATKLLLRQDNYIPGISISPALNLIYRNSSAAKLYPQISVNVFREYGKHKNLLYAGVDNWFELSSRRAFDQRQPNHWIFMPMIGHCFSGKKWNFTIEAKVIAPNLNNERLVVDYQTPFGSHGAMGIYLGYTRKF